MAPIWNRTGLMKPHALTAQPSVDPLDAVLELILASLPWASHFVSLPIREPPVSWASPFVSFGRLTKWGSCREENIIIVQHQKEYW